MRDACQCSLLTEIVDVRALLPDDSILNATALDTFREYNTEQMTQVKSPNNNHEVLLPLATLLV